MSNQQRLLMIDSAYPGMSLREQCKLLGINRSRVYYQPHKDLSEDVALMHQIDKIYTDKPYYGYRKINVKLRGIGLVINDKRVLRLMRIMGIQATVPGPHTSTPHPEHEVYPYLLRNFSITRPNQVWATDITYIRLGKGFCYLVAIMDWFSRYILSWRLSPTLESSFCVEALEEALLYAVPDIFNTDQGSQFTSKDFTDVLKNAKVKISMDGRGSYMDNIFTERLWRSLKYEEVYLKDYRTFDEAESNIEQYFSDFNYDRPHQALDYHMPYEVHNGLYVPVL